MAKRITSIGGTRRRPLRTPVLLTGCEAASTPATGLVVSPVAVVLLVLSEGRGGRLPTIRAVAGGRVRDRRA